MSSNSNVSINIKNDFKKTLPAALSTSLLAPLHRLKIINQVSPVIFRNRPKMTTNQFIYSKLFHFKI